MDSRFIERRKKELEQREEELLSIALELASSEGLHKVSPGEVAKKADYSRATVYKMFPSREDLLAVSAIHSVEKQIALYTDLLPQWEDEVSSLVVISLLYLWHIQKNPTLFQLSLIGRAQENLSACTDTIVERHRQAESTLYSVVLNATESAASSARYNGESPILDSVNAIRAMITGFGLFQTKIRKSVWQEGITDRQTSRIILNTMRGLGWDTSTIDIDAVRTKLKQQLE